ncbi:MAG: hypothetical protein GKR88_19925 [Flavobacteriaceae bacterium]|nr:MAG: hypothetical protein GKR88_19925 [Flavobacteriaceae bacterium]
MKNVFFALGFMLISSVGFASTNVESNLDVNSENVTELLSAGFESSMISYENFTVKTLTIDLGLLGCTSYVTIFDKDTKEILAEFEYYDEGCEVDMQMEWYYF